MLNSKELSGVCVTDVPIRKFTGWQGSFENLIFTDELFLAKHVNLG